MKTKHAILWLLCLFVLSIIVRTPHLGRPLSKHHEFNPAVVLLGLESWKQGGGAGNFNFVPLLTYQNAADRLLQKGPYIDKHGNQIYLSFGPGWYVIPYLAFEAFNIPFTPIALQVVNLLFLLASVVLLFRSVRYLFAGVGMTPNVPAVAACFIYLFNPEILWFLGNGYVCTGIVMPFLIVILHYGTKMLFDPAGITSRSLIAYSFAGLVAIYLDWFGVSFLATVGFFSLLQLRKNQKAWILLLVSGATIIVGMLLIFLQFVSYAGYDAVYGYWTSRYVDRGIANPDINRVLYLGKIFQHLATGFFPVFLCIAFAVLLRKRNRHPQSVANLPGLSLRIAFFGCIFHAIIFFNWTGSHDFAVIPFSLVLALIGAIFSVELSRKQLAGLAITTFTLSLIQYYLINYPGKKNLNGFPYNAYQKTGEAIQKLVAGDERIFCNENYAIYQYYARRNFTKVGSYESAVQWAAEYGVEKGVWIKLKEVEKGVVIEEIKRLP